jgi:hypothetical protein
VSVKRVGWVRVGERRTAAKVNHAMAVNMYAGITKFGVTKPHFVAGTSKMVTSFTNNKGKMARNITTEEYKHVLASTLLPEGKRLFSAHGVSNWVLQQDNDPTHKKAAAAALKEWNQASPGGSVTLVPNWPPNSPDLSPIENVWSYVDARVGAAGCKTFDESQKKVMTTFKELPHNILNNLYMSMKSRLAQCIERLGAKTDY